MLIGMSITNKGHSYVVSLGWSGNKLSNFMNRGIRTREETFFKGKFIWNLGLANTKEYFILSRVNGLMNF